MRNIMFYIESRNILPHINIHGEVHVPISKFRDVATDIGDRNPMIGVPFLEYPTPEIARSEMPSYQECFGRLISALRDKNYPTNGTIQQNQD